MKKKITSKTHWMYRGKCRNCQRVENWCAGKKGSSADYAKFVRVTTTFYFPAFIAFCDGCDNHGVHDLLGYSTEAD